MTTFDGQNSIVERSPVLSELTNFFTASLKEYKRLQKMKDYDSAKVLLLEAISNLKRMKEIDPDVLLKLTWLTVEEKSLIEEALKNND